MQCGHSFQEISESDFSAKGFRTPLLFRPRKFSSPYQPVPKYQYDEIREKTIYNDFIRSSLFDSGIGSTFAEGDGENSRLCPRYHNDGLCELGPKCPLVHEEKKVNFEEDSVTCSLFNPQATEFIPSHLRCHNNETSSDDVIAKDLTNLALGSSSLFSSERSFENEIEPGPCMKKNKSLDLDTGELTKSISELKPYKFKTEPCITFHTIGSCPYGETCNFYHKTVEKTVGRTKTRLCKAWSMAGKCSYGEKCDFAHGSDELFTKFKTRMCKVFFATGRCPYGAQCTFAHHEMEKRKDLATIYKFKTEICQRWLLRKCSFGPACHFAHGVGELLSHAE